jgi:glutamate 5-kinase
VTPRRPSGGTARAAVAAARRIVVKVGSSSLTGQSAGAGGASGIDDQRLSALVDALAGARAPGRELVLVSSGAIAAGLGPMSLSKRPRDLATQQAAASVGQGLLMHRYTQAFARHGITVGQVLLTAEDVVRRAHYRNAERTLSRLLDLGVVPVVNENDTVATDEIRFGDNDRLAALVAHVVRADLLVLLSDVDGLYDGDPRRDGAVLLADVRGEDDMAGVVIARATSSGLGTGGMASKVEAARIATAAGIPTVVAHAESAADALAGFPTGTLFHPVGRRSSTRLLWLAHATTPAGQLRLDEGAVTAVVDRRMSLLPAGVVSVSGRFVAGDPVELLDQNGHAVARGLVNFDATELPDLLGRSTRELARELGPAYRREVVHRDDLVLLRR